MPYKKSAISSAQIVQAAMRVMARQGYARTSLMDIAKEAGMSKGAVHYHFPSKEALVSKVLETACDAVAQRTIEVWGAGGDPFASLQKSRQANPGSRRNASTPTGASIQAIEPSPRAASVRRIRSAER